MSGVGTELPRIAEVLVDVCRMPLPDGPWGDQIHHVTAIEIVLVRMTGTNGVVGIGATHTSGMGGATLGALCREIGAELVGRPLSPRALWQHAYRFAHDIGGAGATTHAISGLDLAAWDLLGKTLGVPVVDLLGRVRDRVAVYGSGINLNRGIEDVVDQVRRWEAAGYAFGKVKVGKPDIEEDVARLSRLREAVGPYPIALDANQGWDLPGAVRAMRAFAPFEPLWVEEPLPADDIAGHGTLHRSCPLPIAVGENVYTVEQFDAYLSTGSIGYVQADLGRVGGITGYVDIAAVARARHVPMVPHFMFELSATVLGAMPNGLAAESTDGGRWTELGVLSRAGAEKDGYYIPAELPGLGVEWDLDRLLARRLGV